MLGTPFNGSLLILGTCRNIMMSSPIRRRIKCTLFSSLRSRVDGSFVAEIGILYELIQAHKQAEVFIPIKGAHCKAVVKK